MVHPEKVWIVIVLVVIILAVTNFAMYALVRGWTKPGKGGGQASFTETPKTVREQNENLKELNERVQNLNKDKQTP